MTEILEAFMYGVHVGQFRFTGSRVSFHYDEDAPAMPISMSLPRAGGAAERAAQNFLANLLPENSAARTRMANAYGASGTSVFDLLSAAGGDVAGGLSLLPEGRDVSGAPSELSPALNRDIAGRIAAIKRDSADTPPVGVPSRFSLAGAQGKFALSWVERDWYWSNETVPSTHIVKPGSPKYRGIEHAEAAALTLAAEVGIAAPQAEVMEFVGHSAFVVERFDRSSGDSALARRIHVEDLVQSLGRRPNEKYVIAAKEVLFMLDKYDLSGALRRAFLQQLAFNVLVGNADAHAKNYSIVLRTDSVQLAPIYDVVPIYLYPEVEQRLAMSVGGADIAQAVNPSRWRKLSKTAGLDADEVLDIVREIAERVGELNETAWEGLEPDQRQRVIEFVSANVDRALGNG